MPVPESLSRVVARVDHVRVSVADVDAARDMEDTGEIVLVPAPVIDLTDATLSLERLRARGVPIFAVTRSA